MIDYLSGKAQVPPQSETLSNTGGIKVAALRSSARILMIRSDVLHQSIQQLAHTE